MKKVTFLLLTLFMVSAVYSQLSAQVLFNENFNYTVGTKLTTVGYVNNTGTGYIQQVVTGNLSYPNYALSNIGGMISVQGGPTSREDVIHSFNKVSSGSVYTAFLVKVDTANVGDYFFHYYYKRGTNGFFSARTYVKGNGNGTFKFGISKAKTDTSYTTANYKYGDTLLVVVKYEVVGDTVGHDDKVSLFVNPNLAAGEPTSPDLTQVDNAAAGTTDSPLNNIAIRQGSDVYTLNMDGIRVSTLWDSLNVKVPVTFGVKMNIQIREKKFDPSKDKVVISGSFQKDAGDAGNWGGGNSPFVLTDANNDSIYTATVYLPAAKAGTSYEYKFVANGTYEGQADNRKFTLAAPGPQVLPVYYFSNDSVFKAPNPYIGKTYHITFQADISKILGTGAGFFDPTRDSIIVDGLNWQGGTNVTGNRLMEATLTAGIYEVTLSVKATEDSTKWKFHAFPADHFGNTGWETGVDRWFVYGKDTTLTIGPIVPRITPSAPALTQDVNVLFQVNMNGAKNAYDNSDIPLSAIEFVGVKGSAAPIGSWNGSWIVADTTTSPKTLIPLNDKGLFGDKVAGDGIYSRIITFPSGTPGGLVEYKFGCWYTDAATHAGESTTAVLDNEYRFQINHSFQLVNSTTTINLKNDFGIMTTGVKQVNTNQVPTVYALQQNFPNPFNPATVIRYSVPQAGIVTLKIYNMLGQEVATLVNKEQPAGNYEASFDASKLSSGIYLYNLTSGSFSSTKKMMLVK